MIALTVNGKDLNKLNIYYLSVGSGHYINGGTIDSWGLGKLEGARLGAKRVSEILSRSGAVYGIELLSHSQLYVTSGDVTATLSKVIKEANADSTNNAFIVIYLAGHGLSEGISWNQFLIPGNVRFYAEQILEDEGNRDILKIGDIELIAEATIWITAIDERLNESGIPYLLLIDACQEGEEQNFKSPVLSLTVQENLQAITDVLRRMNQFHHGNPVLFSARPGEFTHTVPDVRVLEIDGIRVPVNSIAPLARRFTLVYDYAVSEKKSLSLKELVEFLTDPELDSETTAAITYATEESNAWNKVLLDFEDDFGMLETQSGSGVEEVLCCNEAVQSVEEIRFSGSLQIKGATGEWVSGGRDHFISTKDATLDIIVNESGALELFFERDKDFYSIGFNTRSNEEFEPKRYDVNFKESNSWEGTNFNISAQGRGCNDQAGYYVFEEIRKNQVGQIIEANVTFRQYCDDEKTPINGLLV
ncbi:MAG: hypothetical protein MJA83_19270, partial [Gammaproteobacteria bacterium]|nr:hypothetical protein [Gammaproteobacteria bacterium]